MKMDSYLFTNQTQLVRRCARATMVESSIDYPRDTLSPALWSATASGEYAIRQDAKQVIYAALDKYPSTKLRAIAKEIRIVGSICSNQYVEETDVDVHIVLGDLYIKHYGPEQLELFQRSVKSWFDLERFSVGAHPIEVYIQLNPSQDFLSVGVYDMENETWKKGPTLVPLDYDPYDDFSDLIDDIRSSVSNADLLFGELRRDIIDWETMSSALNSMDHDQRSKLLSSMEGKLEEIEDDIEQLYGERKDWVEARKTSTAGLGTVQQALEDVQLASKWKDANALMKFINRYRYIKVVGELAKLVEDDEIDSSEVETAKRLMGEL